MAFMFDNLDVYQKAINLADQILVATAQFPRGFHFLSAEFNRASVSIATNLAQGNRRFTKADRKNPFTIARGSAQCQPTCPNPVRPSVCYKAGNGPVVSRK